ncbi:MAG TPA: tyrosine-protein phosphatase [Pirellulales bacterium]|nr:tyrosine-protein phosphatase [Pirellulales bacterium]
MTRRHEHPPVRSVRRRALAILLVAATVLACYFAFWHYHLKRFQVVRAGVFYRVAQPSEFGMRYLVRHCGVKTVVSVQLYDFRLRRGLCDLGHSDGGRESQYVSQLGARGVRWPMGDENYWPWLTPWQFEEFFELMDDPAHWPVAVHCQGGRHRTGTLAALFRLEYDRWPVDRALAEMYAFKFGPPVRLQEHNLRTYLPRARPTASEWDALGRHWRDVLACEAPADYDALIRRLRAERRRNGIENRVNRALGDDLDQASPFALPLAERLLDEPGDALAARAGLAAAACLERPDARAADWAAAAALIADFGDPNQQGRLLELLADAELPRVSPERFDSLVAGVTNRFTSNRVPFLRPLLEQEGFHRAAGAQQCRYCDTAVARLSTIINRNLLHVTPAMGLDGWNFARQAARDWFAAQPAEARLSRLQPPAGNNTVRPGDPVPKEDLSKLRR